MNFLGERLAWHGAGGLLSGVWFSISLLAHTDTKKAPSRTHEQMTGVWEWKEMLYRDWEDFGSGFALLCGAVRCFLFQCR